MLFFYYDDQLQCFEHDYQWNESIEYLEKRYSESKSKNFLYSLIGYSWYYTVEGPIISKRYADDPTEKALEFWGKYIRIGEEVMANDPYFCFIAGYTLSLHGFILSELHEKKGEDYMIKCILNSHDELLTELAKNFLKNMHSRKYMPIQNGEKICQHLFNTDSLLDQYFKEMYAGC